MSTPAPTVLIRRTEVVRRTDLPVSTIYFWMSEGKFPRPVKIGKRAVAWYESEIEQWIAARAGRAATAPAAPYRAPAVAPVSIRTINFVHNGQNMLADVTERGRVIPGSIRLASVASEAA